MKYFITTIALCSLLLASCSWFTRGNPDPDFDKMYKDGSEELDKKLETLTPKSPTMDNTNDTVKDKQLAPPEAGDKIAIIETNFGTIKFKFFDYTSPELSKNFMELAKRNYYDGVTSYPTN